MNKEIRNLLALCLLGPILLSGCNDDDSVGNNSTSSSQHQVSNYHKNYQKLDESVTESLPEKYLEQYDDAVNKSKNGQHKKALTIFENLLLKPEISSNEKYFSMIDVRYQSIVRATSENERASKLYEKLIENGHGYEYIKVAFNFNKFLLIQKKTQHEINKLLSKEEYAKLPDTHIENIVYISKSIINEGINAYAASIERVNTTSNNQQKTKTTAQNIRFSKFDKKSSELISTKNIEHNVLDSLYDVELNLSNGNSDRLVYLLSTISNNNDASTTFEYLSKMPESNQLTKLVAELSYILNQYIFNYQKLYTETLSISQNASYSEYIVTTLAFFKYFSPFEKINESHNVLNTYLDTNPSANKESVLHHQQMFKNWSMPVLNTHTSKKKGDGGGSGNGAGGFGPGGGCCIGSGFMCWSYSY